MVNSTEFTTFPHLNNNNLFISDFHSANLKGLDILPGYALLLLNS
jgi:hypothetical protein